MRIRVAVKTLEAVTSLEVTFPEKMAAAIMTARAINQMDFRAHYLTLNFCPIASLSILLMSLMWTQKSPLPSIHSFCGLTMFQLVNEKKVNFLVFFSAFTSRKGGYVHWKNLAIGWERSVTRCWWASTCHSDSLRHDTFFHPTVTAGEPKTLAFSRFFSVG